jgi:hypothetical protein
MRLLGPIEHASILNGRRRSVKLLDTLAGTTDPDRARAELRRRLERNRRRRERARQELDAARVELAQLLAAGRKAGLGVADMSRTAGVSRETAHTLLRLNP